MRRLTGGVFQSLDGVMQAPGAPTEDWTGGFALKLVEYQVSTTGVTIATYEPAGDVPIGSFALGEPSEREVARQERMKREGQDESTFARAVG